MRFDVRTTIGGCIGRDRAELGDRHRRLGEQLEEERLELVVGAVDLVDQQHHRPWPGVLDRPQQRPADEVVGGEQVVGGDGAVGGLGGADRQQLAGVVPLVQRLGRGDALVALQPHERGVEGAGRAPWPPPSCRRPPRPPAAAAGAVRRRRTGPSPARGRRGSRPRRAAGATPATSRPVHQRYRPGSAANARRHPEPQKWWRPPA